ncbi:16S rRNA (uracil(1498)-N(3))-methyltransferase [Methylococcus sp. EFPC2]|uniref:16S rRNA (uracil(1498)-N(3))-methyltransferase n=1 Tax=Methylococcus sp. EFPC2 TaxID=2812648 RepID=UPI001967F76A|nr:16S rRNA (uracil(1498)-N(3))-methyltransferase [Methylococcus sp. EFPC2]QSA96274.1 16S rRNA (uracil(1498)-N(3))-methyltransferase [Methylococcus sp. EFPC2]
MRISRFHLTQPLQAGATIALDDERAHYLRTVLRLKKGAELTVFNGEGGEYPAVLVECHREAVRLELGEFNSREAESPLSTFLGLGISRGERMDLGIQKAVELGVTAITPLLTERCVVQLDEARKQQRRQHWQRVVQSACEQCGRNRIPPIHEPEKLEHWLPRQTGTRLFLHPHGGRTLNELPRPDSSVTLLGGPEGGFSEFEGKMALGAGFTPLRLGPRILRTETAALAALAAIQAVWGDFR